MVLWSYTDIYFVGSYLRFVVHDITPIYNLRYIPCFMELLKIFVRGLPFMLPH